MSKEDLSILELIKLANSWIGEGNDGMVKYYLNKAIERIEAAEQSFAPDGAVCPDHQTYFEADGTCAIVGCKHTRPAGKNYRSAASLPAERKVNNVT